MRTGTATTNKMLGVPMRKNKIVSQAEEYGAVEGRDGAAGDGPGAAA